MIPILYDRTETAFTSDGIGRLVDCIECTVTEERNGVFSCEFKYPVTGMHFNDIEDGRIIACAHDDTGEIQPFDIYAHSEPINGVVTFKATHISYRQNEIVVSPYTANTADAAIGLIQGKSYTTNPFTYLTDIVSATAFSLDTPTAAMSVLGGMEGSILDTYGGEYEFDKFKVHLWARRGEDTNVTIQYAKNLIDYEREIDFSAVYNGYIPYWKGVDADSDADLSVYGDPVKANQTLYNGRDVYVPLDLSDEFEEQPTKAEIEAKAAAELTATQPWLPDQNVKVDFVALWQVEEYKRFAPMTALKLCDTAHIEFPMYGLSGTMKVVKTVYNVLSDRYDEIELGKLQTSLAQALNVKTEKEIEKVNKSVKRTSKIAGNTNQYFWHTETGTDTGAHITEIPRAAFLADPTNGGGNLLARSNGITVRHGLQEMATFGADGIRMQDEDENEIFSVGVRSGDITHILRYGYPSSNGYGGLINLGRSIDTFTSISVTYHPSADPTDINTLEFTTLPISIALSDTDLYALYVTQDGTNKLDINFYSKDDNGYGELVCDNITICFTTNQITSEMDLGIYPDTTMIAPLRIGNGTANYAKSNAMAVDWAGNLMLQGNDVRVNCNADSSGGTSLVKGEYFNGYYMSDSTAYIVIDVYKVGRLVTLLCQCQRTYAVTVGANFFTGVTPKVPRPAMEYATGAGFYGQSVVGGFLSINGDDQVALTVRNVAGQTVSTNAVVYCSITYISEE